MAALSDRLPRVATKRLLGEIGGLSGEFGFLSGILKPGGREQITGDFFFAAKGQTADE
jgi:hypothetical protein